MFKNVYNALWTPQNRPTIKMNWRGKLKARLIPNIFLNKSNLSKTEIENVLESESGIFLLNKLETFEDALWKLQNFNTENWKPCTLDLSPYGMRNAEKIEVRPSLCKCSWSDDFVSKVISGFRQAWRKTFQIDLKCLTFQKDLTSDIFWIYFKCNF